MFPMLMAFLASLWALLLACIAFVSRAVLLCGDALRLVFRLLSVIICVLRMLISAVEATAKLTCVISRLVPKLFHLFVSRLVIPTAHAVPRITRAAFQIAQRMTHCACGVARQSLARASHVCHLILSAAFMTKAYEKLRLGVVFASNLLARAITTLVTTSISVSLAPSVRCTSVPFAHLNGDANPVSELDAMVPPKMRSGQFVDRELLKHHVWSGSRTMDETVIVLTCHIKRENAFRSTRVKEMLGDANIPFREIDVSYEHHEVVRVAYLAISGETDLPQVFRQSSSGDSIEFIGGHDAIMYLNDLENLPDHIMAKWGIENLTTRFQGVKKPRSMMQEWEQAELQKFMRFRKDIFHKPISVHTKIFEPSPALSDRSAKWTDESKEEGGGVDVEWTTERECKLRRKYSDEPMDIDAMIEFSLNTFTKRESRFRHGRWSLAMDPSVLDILSQAWSPAQGPFWVDYKGVIA